jgi:hypothetical protein
MKTPKKLSPQMRYVVGLALVLSMSAIYGLIAYSIYDALRHPDVVPVQEETKVKSSTLRVQERLEAKYLTAETQASMFTFTDEIAAKHNVTITVDSVTNLQPSAKGKGAPVSSVDMKVSIRGEWEHVQKAARALEHVPTVSHVVDAEILEDKDSSNPIIRAQVRFFVAL